ncbi:MAG TPA: MBOAT family protein [Candidatus Limnocylindria bacterium]|jgi:D-alanyl-lipoteichoic acid acyltransferase DltB (MBOAT superfamily)|nr:MBOAT family protein [Candidatus Limnocylindria bacterium]
MSFASLVFLLFLPVVFGLHYAVRGRNWQNAVLLMASYVFYGWWDWRYCGLMLGASLFDYWLGARIAEARSVRSRKWLLALSLTANLGLLGFFKYFNFFADSLAVALSLAGIEVGTSTLSIVLPVGISFYTFQTLSYTLDIYRGRFQPRKDLLEYLTFVSFFPQLVAGPIERATDLLPQFSRERTFSPEAAVAGCRLMLWGFAKKMILADNLGLVADAAFGDVNGASGPVLLLGVICFAFQIYGDFSGYSDIAVGVARLFGITLQRNFAFPYFSQSLTEFWRRWHISLSTWFRDYVFISLGGSRGTERQTARNILITFLLSGFWHGAAWHFVIWGALHGTLLVGERCFAGRNAPPRPEEIPGGATALPPIRVLLRMALTFLIVCIGWIFFRADTTATAFRICGRIVSESVHAEFYAELWQLLLRQQFVLIGLPWFVLVEWLGRRNWNPLRFDRLPTAGRWLAYAVVMWCILLLGTQNPADFIYFQF